MEESAIRNVLILVCGIPGSGKSTLCEKLMEYLKSQSHSCRYIEADAIEKRIFSNKLTQTTGTIEQLMSELMEFQRIQPSKGLCNEINANILKCNQESNIFDANCWKESREASKEVIRLALQNLQSSPQTDYLLFEDVLNLRSQRQDYLNIARITQNTKKAGFCQIFVNSTLEDCIQRDKLRETHKQVGEVVITKSLNQFDPVENTTESAFSIIYSSNEMQQNDENPASFLELVRQLEKKSSVSVKPKILENSSNDNPADKANLMQLIDLNLRNIVSTYLKESVHSISGKSNEKLHSRLSGEHLSVMKKLFLILVAPFVHSQQLPASGILPSIEQQIQQNILKQWKKLGFSDDNLKELCSNLTIALHSYFEKQSPLDIQDQEGNEVSDITKDQLIEGKAKDICKLFETELLVKL